MVSEPRVVYRHFIRDSTRWDGFEFRPGDIVISAPAKCGTTWLQMICALLIFRTTSLPAPLSRISPWLDMLTRPLPEVIAELEAQRHRRFIKTHTPLDGLPVDPGVTYIGIGRDPRDVGLSHDNHRLNQDRRALARARSAVVGARTEDPVALNPKPTVRERFWAWVDNPALPTDNPSTLRMTLHHLDTLWRARDQPNIVLLHFSDLTVDLEGQMRALAGRLDLPVPERCWPDLVSAARIEHMRAHADQLAPEADQGLWHDNARFFASGSNGQWRALLDQADLIRYHQRVAELVDAELATWVHREPHGK